MNANDLIWSVRRKSPEEAGMHEHITSVGLALLEEVNRRAEADILKGNPITGAHHRAIEQVLEELIK